MTALRRGQKIKIGYGAAVLLLIVTFILSADLDHKLARQTEWVEETNAVISNLESISSRMKDAETSLRGYLLIPEEEFIEPYYQCQRQIDSLYDVLTAQLKTNPEQLDRLRRLRTPITLRFGVFNRSLSMYAENNYKVTEDMKLEGRKGRDYMDEIRVLINEMEQSERAVLDANKASLDKILHRVNFVNYLLLAIAIILAGYAFITFSIENRDRRKASQQATDYRVKLEEQIEALNKSNKELIELRSMEKFAITGRVARTIAHEVRNPLTNIDLALDQLRTEVPNANEDVLTYFDMISRNSKRINQLISELLSSTKFAELKFEPVKIDELIHETIALAKDRLALKHMEIVGSFSACQEVIIADREKLQIALLNIIVNAVEAMNDETGLLVIDCDREKDSCVIRIQDNGAGMDEETLHRLFDAYFTSKSTGTGLGLTATQNIVLNHKGTIDVESEIGEGTLFTIQLPVSQQHS